MNAAASYRLALVSDADVVGGAEVFLATLAGQLPAEVGVAIVAPEPVAKLVTRARAGAEFVAYQANVLALRRALRRLAPDIVHINATNPKSCRPAIFAALWEHMPFLLVDHSPYGSLTRSGRWAQRALSRFAARRVAVCAACAFDIERTVGLRPASVQVIRNGVVPLAACAQRPSVADGFVLGAMGRLSVEKGIDVLLDAMVLLGQRFRLRVAGSGPLAAELEAQADRLNLSERVEFLGHRCDVGEFMCSVDLLVLPSRSEGLPLTAIEAMFCARPVVACDVGGVAEVVTAGSTGWLTPPDDPDALAATILQATAVRSRLTQRGEAGRRRAEADFTAARMATEYDGAYRQCLRL